MSEKSKYEALEKQFDALQTQLDSYRRLVENLNVVLYTLDPVDYRALSKEGQWTWLSVKNMVVRQREEDFEMAGSGKDDNEQETSGQTRKESGERRSASSCRWQNPPIVFFKIRGCPPIAR